MTLAIAIFGAVTGGLAGLFQAYDRYRSCRAKKARSRQVSYYDRLINDETNQ